MLGKDCEHVPVRFANLFVGDWAGVEGQISGASKYFNERLPIGSGEGFERLEQFLSMSAHVINVPLSRISASVNCPEAPPAK